MAVESITRRRFVSTGSALVGGAFLAGAAARAAPVAILDSWTPGFLDIHHIDTGRGNATFIVAPDGTTILLDCGASNTNLEETSPRRPDASRSPAAWVARYMKRHAPHVLKRGLDFAVASHIHPDHIGDVPPGAAAGPRGYCPTGLSEVDELIPIRTVIDRAFPDFDRIQPPDAPFTSNYLAWLRARAEDGRRVEAAQVGSSSQIAVRDPRKFPDFEIHIVAADGRVSATETRASVDTDLPDAKMPPKGGLNENSASIALRISHGAFSYFNGSDLSFDTDDGRRPWADIETPAARACGPVDVAVANHHGYFDAVGPEADRLLNPQAYIIPAWHISHPGQTQMQRMLRAWPGQPLRDVFALELLPQNRMLNARFVKSLKSTQGHVVIRVPPGGESFNIFVLDSADPECAVSGTFGPYVSRGPDRFK